MPQTDYDPISPLDVLVTEIDAQISSQTERLIACKAVDHDHITGILKGLQTAKQRAIELRKTWHGDEPQAQVEIIPTASRPSRLRRV
jgi:hypothetical protein